MSEDSLFFNFIKNQFQNSSTIIDNYDVYSLSNDITFKLHEFAQMTKNIVSKCNRSSVNANDLGIALKLTFSNILLVPDHPKNFAVNDIKEEHLTVQISSKSMTNESLYRIPELSDSHFNCFNNLMKCFFHVDNEVVKFALSTLINRSDLNNIVSLLLSCLNDQLEDIKSPGFLDRVRLILRDVVSNPHLPLSENPLRDLFISITLKLLWSHISVPCKLKTAELLNHIISRQYLQKEIVRKMLINTLFLDFDEEFHKPSRYSGSLIGLVAVDLVSGAVMERLARKLRTLPLQITSSSCIQESVAVLICVARKRELLCQLSYSTFFSLLDTYLTPDCVAMVSSCPSSCCHGFYNGKVVANKIDVTSLWPGRIDPVQRQWKRQKVSLEIERLLELPPDQGLLKSPTWQLPFHGVGDQSGSKQDSSPHRHKSRQDSAELPPPLLYRGCFWSGTEMAPLSVSNSAPGVADSEGQVYDLTTPWHETDDEATQQLQEQQWRQTMENFGFTIFSHSDSATPENGSHCDANPWNGLQRGGAQKMTDSCPGLTAVDSQQHSNWSTHRGVGDLSSVKQDSSPQQQPSFHWAFLARRVFIESRSHPISMSRDVPDQLKPDREIHPGTPCPAVAMLSF